MISSIAEFVKIFRLLFQLVVRPVKTIKLVDTTDYNKQYMFLLFVISTIFNFILFPDIRFFLFAPADILWEKIILIVLLLLFVAIIAPIVSFSLFNLIYYILIRLFAHQTISYSEQQLMLLPILILMNFARVLVVSFNMFLHILPVSLILQLISVWMNVLIYLYLRYKYKESAIRSFLVVGTIILVQGLLFIIISALK